MSKFHVSQGIRSSTTNQTTQPSAFAPRRSLGVLPSERSADLQMAPLVARHSSPNLLTAAALDPSDVAESVLMRTQVRIAGLATQHTHCVYLLEVDSGAGSTPHVIPKRFSEIRDFRAQLLEVVCDKKTHCGHGPCAQLAQLAQIKFPRRQLRIPGLSAKREANFDVAHQRVSLLERFLQAMLRVYRMTTRRQLRVCTNSRCVVLGMIQQFLNVAEPTASRLLDQEQQHRAAMNADYTMTRGRLSEVMLPGDHHSYPELTYSTLCGDRPSSLYPIDETPETVA